MRIEVAKDQEMVSRWVADQLGFDRGFDQCNTIGVYSGNSLIAGLVLHNYNPEAGVIEITCASTSPKWFTREVASETFHYVFDLLGCQMVIARHSVNNARARRLWHGLGAIEHIIPRLRGRNEDEAIATLTAETWQHSKFRIH